LQTEIEPMLEAEAVAKILGVNRKWVYQAALDGKLPAYRFGSFVRFRESEIRQWIADQAVGRT